MQPVLDSMVAAANASRDCMCRMNVGAGTHTSLLCKRKQPQHVLQLVFSHDSKTTLRLEAGTQTLSCSAKW